ncbi:MAG: GlyGly-CTERM sorting domain-containing protein [Gammaproteobacteria bacterium]|nr:GlyGly-CTERM sorting domain-containing protein [Gammaproteobacteria bacterium]
MAEPAIAEQYGRAAVDKKAAEWIAAANQIHATAGTHVNYRLRSVSMAGNDEFGPALASGEISMIGASYGVMTQVATAGSDLANTLSTFGADHLVYLVPEVDQNGWAGHARNSQIVTVAFDAAMENPVLVAHEMAHSGAALSDLTGNECDGLWLMCGNGGQGALASTTPFKASELDAIAQAVNGTLPAVEDFSEAGYLGRISAEMPVVGHLVVESAASSVAENGGAVDITVRLVPSDPLTDIDRPVSAQLYVSGVAATAGEDFEETLVQLEFLPGETEKAATIQILDDSVAEQAEAIEVGVRYGNGVEADSVIVVQITDNDSSGGGENPGGGGGGSFGWLSLAAMGLLLRWRRK